MTKRYIISKLNQITIIRFPNQPNIDDIRDAIDDASKSNPNRLRLWDLSQGGLDLSSDQLRSLAEYGKKKFDFDSRVAIVASRNLAYGLSRMYEAYRENDQTETKVFRTEHEALSWLKNTS